MTPLMRTGSFGGFDFAFPAVGVGHIANLMIT